MKNFANMFSQISKMQEKMKAIQKELESREVEASAGGDMVTVKMNGKKEVIEIKINKEVVNPDEVEMLEDLLVAAINQAQTKVQEVVSEEMGKLTGGLNIPGMPDMSGLM
ncbi:MAG: YbaB/EbfC family nucleoid-associated protein [Spirochaetes bacterium]|nr:YbaB/EbfC family nucleoid-associated protein [Spirochaetota bacterium]